MQNKQLSDVKGKELVAAGHAFAKAIGMDTPLIEIAKMVSELAARLDCALVRGDAHKQDVITWEKSMMEAIGEDGTGSVAKAIAELKAQRDALAAENTALKSVIESVRGVADNSEGIAGWHRNGDIAGWDEILPEINDIETPATDAYLNSVRADSVEDAAKRLFGQGYTFEVLTRFAAKLRAGEPS